MKVFSLLLSLTILCANIHANSFICIDTDKMGPEFSLDISFQNEELVYLINGEDQAYIDDSYEPRSPFFKSWKKIIGYFPSLGDGVDGFGVTIIVNKFLSDVDLLNEAQFGMLDYRASGPEGYYSVRYKCERTAE